MHYEGNLHKMRSEAGSPVSYHLSLGDQSIKMNDLIGQEVELKYLQEIHCIKCGRKTSKSFAQGFCFPCFRSAPETEECVLRPELCRAHEGVARDMEFARGHCLIDHFVYLSVTSGIKVGVTRNTQIPTRWIDQGALSAVVIARTPNRYTAGLIEVTLKAHLADKTNWRNMLKGKSHSIDLLEEQEKAQQLLPADLAAYAVKGQEVVQLEYPVAAYPDKVQSVNLDKSDTLAGRLAGIKGQYLIFYDGQVINIRKYGGYRIRLSV